VLDLIEFIGWICEWLLSWRFFLALAVTTAVIFLIIAIIPDQTIRFGVCTPIAIAGVFFGLRWQNQSEAN
jgi:hypothetical protein